MATSLIERAEIGLSTPCKRWEQGLAPEPEKPCWGPEKFKGLVDFDEYAELGLRLRIPSIHLFGTQLMEQYEAAKRRGVEDRLKRCRLQCLEEHPIPLCALLSGQTLTLAIFDGHHRTRYGGRIANYMVPSVVYTPEQLADILNQNKVFDQPISVECLIDDLNRAVVDTIASFKKSTLPETKYPYRIPVGRIEDLNERYTSF